MKIDVISFTKNGKNMAERIEKTCKSMGEIHVYHKPEEGVMNWTKEHFSGDNALIFVGACGIAVRAVAPHIKDKFTDSAVLVIDEKGQFVIPVLSGHVGGANELAENISKVFHAVPVITTATDVNHRFAVDVFAVKNHFRILNREAVKIISGKILANETVSISVQDYISDGKIPKGLKMVSYPPEEETDIVISTKENALEKGVLRLRPADYVMGIGCRQGKSKKELEQFVMEKLEETGLSMKDFICVASIDKKKNETGIIELARENKIEFRTFTAEELLAVDGEFHSSSFVEETVGVDNVCERAAIAACTDGGSLVLHKQAEEGKTIAIAKRNRRISWKGWTENET